MELTSYSLDYAPGEVERSGKGLCLLQGQIYFWKVGGGGF